MGADVKIGLLSGLIFVFVAAFLLSNAPHSENANDNNRLKAFTVGGPPDIRPGILPDALPPYPSDGRRHELNPPPSKNMESIRGLPGTTSPDEISKSNGLMKSSLPEVYYFVQEGDTLADIAKRFYGPEQGNKNANVMRIFKANHNLLESPDEIYPGQKLVIPPLRTTLLGKKSNKSIFPDSMFEEVESIGRRHF